MDFSPVIMALAPLALAAVTAFLPLAVIFFKQKLNIQATDQQVAIVDSALINGANTVYTYLVENGATMKDRAAVAIALRQGTQYVLNQVPDKLKALGITEELVQQKVRARLGDALKQDPTVTIAPPVDPAPAPTPAPTPAAEPLILPRGL